MLIDKNELPMVAMDFMNEVHLEDVDIINELYEHILTYERNPNTSNQEQLDQQYQLWFEHTVAHFRGEEIEMEEQAFPPYMMHKGEHDKALSIMDELFRTWQRSRDINILKNYFTTTLPQWLTHHIQTMDTVTAMFLKTGMSPCLIH